MSGDRDALSLAAAAALAVRWLATTIVALAIVVVADLTLDGAPMVIVAVVVFLALLASYVHRDKAREDPERPRDAFDAVAEHQSAAAQYVPMIVAVGVFVVADLEPAEFAVVAMVLFFVTTTFLVWRYNRVPPRAPAA